MTWLRCVLMAAILTFAGPGSAQTPRTGTFVIGNTPGGLIGDDARAYAGMTRPDTSMAWVVHVPASYDPARPPGILAYVSPTDSGDMPDGWDSVLDRDNLIWIAARDSGNDVETRRRIYGVILALAAVRQHYAVDENRVYLAGFSGGGRVASIMMATTPNLFNGAIYICGADLVRASTKDLAARMKADRYVFVTGGGDFNRGEMRTVYRAFLDAGAGGAHLMDLPHLPHILPGAEDFAAAVDVLDGGGVP